jgi:hypothetical protein
VLERGGGCIAIGPQPDGDEEQWQEGVRTCANFVAGGCQIVYGMSDTRIRGIQDDGT